MRSIPAVIAFAAALAVAGCGSRTYEQHRDAVLTDAAKGDFAAAAAEVNALYNSHEPGDQEEPGDKPTSGLHLDEQQLLLWRMERGALASFAGDLPLADRHLSDAGRVVDERRSKDALAVAASYVANDTVRDYAGRLFEHAQVDYWRAINALVAAQRREGVLGGEPAPKLADGRSAEDEWNRAVNALRKLTMVVLTETKDTAGNDHYRDDPFCRILAAALWSAMPASARSGADEQFCDAMAGSAMTAYAAERKRMGHGDGYRYEVKRRPVVAERLFLRHAKAYDPTGFADRATRLGFSSTELAQADLPAGNGSVLILNHVGWVTRPRSLDIGFLVAGGRPRRPTPEERADGITCTTFSMGALAMYAFGPGSEIVRTWRVVAIPGEAARILAPGGAAVMGLSVPVHPHDRPVPPPAQITATPAGAGGSPVSATLEVACDLDGYTRATLKDDQPEVLAKTITRAVAKQLAGAVASKAIDNAGKRENNEAVRALATVVNLTWSAAMTATENADLRAWTTLPDRIEATLIDLPPGTYDLRLGSGPGQPPAQRVTVTAGRLAIVPFRSFTP